MEIVTKALEEEVSQIWLSIYYCEVDLCSLANKFINPHWNYWKIPIRIQRTSLHSHRQQSKPVYPYLNYIYHSMSFLNTKSMLMKRMWTCFLLGKIPFMSLVIDQISKLINTMGTLALLWRNGCPLFGTNFFIGLSTHLRKIRSIHRQIINSLHRHWMSRIVFNKWPNFGND